MKQYFFSFIQNSISADIGMADAMLSSGKIYVVVGVLLLIFIGIIIFLLSQEKRIKKIEQQINNNHSSNQDNL